MNRVYIVGILIVVIVVLIAFIVGKPYSSSGNIRNPSPTPFRPYSASFGVFTNGSFRTFSSPMYLNKSSDVYIQSRNPNIVLVQKSGITWQYFFDTLPIKLSSSCLTTGTNETFCTNEQIALRFFLNGTEDQLVLSKVIEPNDRLLISYGLITEDEVKRQYQTIPSVKE